MSETPIWRVCRLTADGPASLFSTGDFRVLYPPGQRITRRGMFVFTDEQYAQLFASSGTNFQVYAGVAHTPLYPVPLGRRLDQVLFGLANAQMFWEAWLDGTMTCDEDETGIVWNVSQVNLMKSQRGWIPLGLIPDKTMLCDALTLTHVLEDL